MNYTTLHVIFAWLSTFGILLLILLYPLKRYASNHTLDTLHPINKSIRILKKLHKPIGVLVIITALIHGRFSMQHPGMNFGTLCLLLTILLACSYALKKVFTRHWKTIHRILTWSLVIALILHIFIYKN